MSKLHLKFIRKSGNQYQFKYRNKTIFIEDLVLRHDKYTANLSQNNGCYGWQFCKSFVSLKQVEFSCKHELMPRDFLVNYMKNNPDLWGRNSHKNEFQMTKGSVYIVDYLGEVVRFKNFEDKRAKDGLINLFCSEIKNLHGYCVEVNFR